MMQRRTRHWVDVGAAFLIGTLSGLLLADLAFAETAAREWQGLIAGILAVLAAYVTVAEMARLDGRQQDRHAQLVALNYRSDFLVLERAAFLIKKVQSGLLPVPPVEPFTTISAALQWIDNFQGPGMTTLRLARQDEDILAAVKLFDPLTLEAWRDFTTNFRHAEGESQSARLRIGNGSVNGVEVPGDPINLGEALSMMRGAEARLLRCVEAFRLLVGRLEALLSRYAVTQSQ